MNIELSKKWKFRAQPPQRRRLPFLSVFGVHRK